MRLRPLIKEAVYHGLDAFGFAKAARARIRDGVVILTYHSVSESRGPAYEESVPAIEFASQMRHLQQHYDVVGLGEALSWLRHDGAGTRTLRARPLAVVTVDDGFEDNFTTLWPVARSAGIPITVFVATDFIDTGTTPWPTQLRALVEATEAEAMQHPFVAPLRTPGQRASAVQRLKTHLRALDASARRAALDDLREHLRAKVKAKPPLTWGQVREMCHDGVTFGSHTVHHGLLPFLDPSEATRELIESKSRIERELQEPCEWLAYPNGDFDAAVAALATRAGYRAALSQARGVNRPGVDAMALHRVHVPPDESVACFACRASLADFR